MEAELLPTDGAGRGGLSVPDAAALHGAPLRPREPLDRGRHQTQPLSWSHKDGHLETDGKTFNTIIFYIIVVLAYLTSNEAGRRQLHTPSLNPGPPEPVCPGVLRGLKVYVRGF